jgi:predicted ATPase
MSNLPIIVLTGGPGGGKTTMINELSHDTDWVRRIASLPEAISLMGGLGISSRDKLFQHLIVHLQMGLEDILVRTLDVETRRLILCHRGSLDPLAYWMERGWSEQEFFEFTGTTRQEHYQRYSAILHLVTSADGAANAYLRWPQAHRPETPEAAIHLDRILQRVWSGHPRYYRIDNEGRDWPAKAQMVRDILADFYSEI